MGSCVGQSGDSPYVVDVGVGDDDLANIEPRLLYRERDAGGLVARVNEGADAGLLVPDYVAVLLERSDGEHLEDHRARPLKNSTRSRAGAPVAPFGV